MDCMDVDQVVDIPDTPDRVAVENVNGRVCIRKEKNSSMADHSGNRNIFDQQFRNPQRHNNKLVINDGSKRPPSHHLKNLSISAKPVSHRNSSSSALRNLSSSTDSLYRHRIVAGKTVNHDNQIFDHPDFADKRKALSNSPSSVCHKDAAVNSAQQIGNTQVLEQDFPCGAFGNHEVESRKGSISANGSSSLCKASSSRAFDGAAKEKERMGDTCRVYSIHGPVNGVASSDDPQPNGGMTSSVPAPVTAFHHLTSPSKGRGQKRLVRNGCISPLNIAKARQLGERDGKDSVSIVENDAGTVVDNSSSDVVNIRYLVADDDNTHRVKGKGVINNSFSMAKSEAKTAHVSNRVPSEEKASQDFDGWRTTHKYIPNSNFSLSGKDQHPLRGADEAFFANKQQQSRVGRRSDGNGSSGRSLNSSSDNRHLGSFQHGSASSVVQLASHPRSRVDRSEKHHHAANNFIERQKQGSTLSNHGECSTSTDSELVCLGSSGENSNSTSIRSQNHQSQDVLDPVVVIDELSPESRLRSSHNVGGCFNNVTDTRARQVESDEILARELQQKLYDEIPELGVGNVDVNMALTLQQEEYSDHAFSSSNHPIFNNRTSFIPDLSRRSQSSFTQNPSARRGARARASASTRMTRLRNRFPGQSRTIMPRERNSLFPPNVDVDMRMHILEALEAVSDMRVAGDVLRFQHDFDENDYEMLLALDENNHQIGASVRQINSLPVSTVQGDNFEETCAICLDTPTNGDTIRHLPCLHKFHKDCIDEWLRRKTSCPVCKCSIT